MNYKSGNNFIVGENVLIGKNVELGHNCIIEDNVVIGNNCFIDSNTIFRKGSHIGDYCTIGSNCIIGEYGRFNDIDNSDNLFIGRNALIRSGTIIYNGSKIGSNFQTGHRVTIREKSILGNNVSIGTLCDIQGHCKLGNYVRLHSNVHIGQHSTIDSFVWIFPYVVLTNDPTPPSEDLLGVHIHSFAIIATGAVILPGVDIGQDSLVGAGAIVTKPVLPYMVTLGNPAKAVANVKTIKNKITGKPAYPWRDQFSHYMPWETSDFESWFSSLDLNEKEEYSINNLL